MTNNYTWVNEWIANFRKHEGRNPSTADLQNMLQGKSSYGEVLVMGLFDSDEENERWLDMMLPTMSRDDPLRPKFPKLESMFYLLMKHYGSGGTDNLGLFENMTEAKKAADLHHGTTLNWDTSREELVASVTNGNGKFYEVQEFHMGELVMRGWQRDDT